VKVIVTGDQHCKGIEITPDLLKDADVDMLQDLILRQSITVWMLREPWRPERLGPLAGGLPF